MAGMAGYCKTGLEMANNCWKQLEWLEITFFFTSTDYKFLEMAGMAGNGRNGWKFLEMFKCKSTEMLSC